MAYARLDIGGEGEGPDKIGLPSNDGPVVLGKLETQATQVRNQQIAWQSYFQGKVIGEEDFRFIQEYDDADAARRKEMVKNQGLQCVKTLMAILQSINKEQILQYLLTLMDDVVQDDRANISLFHQYAEECGGPIYGHLLKLMNRHDNYIVHMSSRLVSQVVLHPRHLLTPEDQRWYLHWLVNQLAMPNNEYVHCVASALQRLMRVDAYREGLVDVHGIKTLLDVLSNKGTSFQLQYQLIFCLWLMAYNSQVAASIIEMNAIPVLSDILKASGKEKVTRIILASFRNMLEKPEEKSVVHSAGVAMVANKVMTVISVLANKQWEDEDIRDDVLFLQEKLDTCLLDLSSFDEYVAEVKSGRLIWSPVHKSDKFWRENAQRLNEKNHEILRILTGLMQESQDPTILGVAAHDFGEYVRHYPRGKKVLDSLGGKDIIMGLMNHADGQVRYEALVAVQKMMVHNWEYLGKQMRSD